MEGITAHNATTTATMGGISAKDNRTMPMLRRNMH